MQLALAHPDHGYYMNRDPFGATGDFTTAPEISQMFGELIGLWAAEVWSSMGSPDPVRLVELGPGRGTLISDALRAARIVPDFRNALDVRLIETSPTLAEMQHELLVDCGVAVSWAQSLKDVPDGPAIIIGNEFLDALPVRQFVRVSGQWRERSVASNVDGELVFDIADKPEPYIRASAANGEVLEVNPSGHRLMFELGARLVKQGGAALMIDYGHSITGFGDTLQALRAHRYVDPLAEPGDCDLTAHVDFAAMARSAQRYRRRRLRPDRPRRFPARDRHRLEDAGAGRARRARPRRGIPARARAARRQGSGRDGRAVQGDGCRRPEASRAARLPTRDREVRVSVPQFLTAECLRLPGVRTASSPVSAGSREGVYASLNGGVGSSDAPEAVAENRARAAAALGVAPERLAVPYQVHSPDAVADLRALGADARPRCDGLVTATPGPRARRDRRRLRHDPVR